MSAVPKERAFTIDQHPDPEAVYEWINANWNDMYVWGDENVQSLTKFCNYYSLSGVNYSVSMCSHSSATATVPDDVDELRGLQLWMWFKGTAGDPTGDCPFTGYYMDEVLLKPIREFVECPQLLEVTLQELVDKGLTAWVDAYVSDWEHCYSDEGLRDTCLANEWAFYESGEFAG